MNHELTAIYQAATLVKATRFPSPAKDPRQSAQQWGLALEEALVGWKVLLANRLAVEAELDVFRKQLQSQTDVASMIQAPTPEAVAAAMASHT